MARSGSLRAVAGGLHAKCVPNHQMSLPSLQVDVLVSEWMVSPACQALSQPGLPVQLFFPGCRAMLCCLSLCWTPSSLQGTGLLLHEPAGPERFYSFLVLSSLRLQQTELAPARWLKPGGAILPDTATIFVAAASRAALDISFWDDVYGFSYKPVQDEMLEHAFTHAGKRCAAWVISSLSADAPQLSWRHRPDLCLMCMQACTTCQAAAFCQSPWWCTTWTWPPCAPMTPTSRRLSRWCPVRCSFPPLCRILDGLLLICGCCRQQVNSRSAAHLSSGLTPASRSDSASSIP